MAKVIVYTKYGCPKCDMTKNVLTGEGIEFVSINVEDDAESMTYVKETLGFSSMPVVVAEGHEPFCDFRPDLIQKLK